MNNPFEDEKNARLNQAAKRSAAGSAFSALDELCRILGWQGGTIHQALDEVRRLKALSLSRELPGVDKKLSPRQLEIMRMLVAGKTSTEIRARFGISQSTLCTHYARCRVRLGVATNEHAAIVFAGFAAKPDNAA